MSENMWQGIQILMWVLGIQTTILLTGMKLFYNAVNKKFEKIEERFDKIDARFEKIDSRFDKMEGRMTRLENDMIEVKTILRMKECCMINDDRQIKKAE